MRAVAAFLVDGGGDRKDEGLLEAVDRHRVG